MISHLSIQEEQAMQAIWQIGQGSIKMFLEKMDSPQPPYTTFASTIKNLEKKKYVESKLIGNVNLYNPLVTESEYKKKFINGFVKDYFDNSYKELVNFFVDQKKLSPKELKDIISLIESKK